MEEDEDSRGATRLAFAGLLERSRQEVEEAGGWECGAPGALRARASYLGLRSRAAAAGALQFMRLRVKTSAW